jgi:hypothetical protein
MSMVKSDDTPKKTNKQTWLAELMVKKQLTQPFLSFLILPHLRSLTQP